MTFEKRTFEKEILKQLNIDSDDVLKKWRDNPYYMNKDYQLAFWNHVEKNNKIMIVGDYDVDGVLATTILTKAIKSVYPQKKLILRLPKRLSEGYGFNEKIVSEAKEKMPDGGLVITVDNGIAAANHLEELKKSGFTVILTDHHELGSNKIPEVDLVLNPKVQQKKQIFDGDYWCGAAVAYKIAEGIVPGNTAKELKTLAGIATIGDCMPLKEGNWALVKDTLEIIKKGEAPESINLLLQKLKQTKENVSEDTLGFYVCPTINASGRLIDDGANRPLLYFLKPTEERADELVIFNNERKELKEEYIEKAEEYISKNNLKDACPLWIYLPGLHEGIIGIIAGNITEKYKVPTIVLTDSSNPGEIKGSARTAGSINIFEYLDGIKHLFSVRGVDEDGNITYAFGGHPGAAGLSMPLENLPAAMKHELHKPTLSELTNNILMDITEGDIPLIAKLNEKYRPYGENNPAPSFKLDINLENEKYKYLGKPPVHLQISDPLHKYKIMHFFHKPNDLKDENHFLLTGKVGQDYYNGNTTAVLVADEISDPEEDIKDLGR